MSIERQTAALLALVETDRAQRSATILGEARAQARALLAAAHRDARRKMRDAIVEERVRRDERVAAARANLQTRRRVAMQRRASALLAAAWTKLPRALEQRWHAHDTRRAWVGACVVTARKLLPPSGWRIAHPVAWPEAERDALAAELASALDEAPQFVADPGIRAGIRIAAKGNLIDSTLAGLVADRAEIGGALLGLLDERTMTVQR
jgi:hypothetical protein